MRIKNKISLILIPSILFMIILINLTFGFFFHNYIIDQENKQLESIKSNVSSFLREKEQKYIGSVNDWAHWDDTDQFVRDKNTSYLETNLIPSTFEYLDITFLILLDQTNKPVYEGYYFKDKREIAALPPEFETAQVFWDTGKSRNDQFGIYKIGESFYCLASSGVTDSLDVNRESGTLLIGRKIDEELIGKIEGISGSSVSEIALLPKDSDFEENTKNEIGSDTINLKVLYSNRDEKAGAAVFTLKMERELYKSGMNNVYLFFVMNTVVFMTAAIFLFFHLGRIITKPFFELIKNVKNIDITKRHLDRLPEKGKNEFTFLARSINRLLTRIEKDQNNLIEAKEKLLATLISVGDGVISVDNKGNIEFMNPVAERLTGWSLEDAIGLPIEKVFRIISEYTRQTVDSPVRAVFEKEEIVELANHTLLISKDGQEKPVEDTAAPIRDENGRVDGCVLVFRDFSERKEKQRHIEYLSYHDQLTGLYNRRFFEEELKRLDHADNLPLSIVYADVNGLKIANDAFGHETGDQMIRLVADILKAECRGDDVIARIGGDEFVVLLPRTSSTATEKLISRIKEIIELKKVKDIQISISFGWDTKYEISQSSLEILKSAEDYMYKKKILNTGSKRNGIIKSILNTLLIKCPREEAHSERVSAICEEIGKAYGLSADEIKELGVAGELHDIGKIAIDESILNKPGKLTEVEWLQIKRHPEIGYRLLGASCEFNSIAEYVLAHHERWDGTGYPKGLKGEAICWKARVIALADAYDAMTCERPYHKALTREEAINEIRENAGSQFDPAISKVFIVKVLGEKW